MEDLLLTAEEAAGRLGLSYQTINKWIRRGLLAFTSESRNPRPSGPTSIRKVRLSDLEQFRERWGISDGSDRKRIYTIGPNATPRPKKVPAPKPRKTLTGKRHDSRLISQTEAAKVLGVSQACVTKWVTSGRIPTEVLRDRSRRNHVIPRQAFLELVNSGSLKRLKMGMNWVGPRAALKTSSASGSRLISQTEAAKVAGVSISSIGYWISSGWLPFEYQTVIKGTKPNGVGKRVISRDRFMAWLKSVS